MTVGDPKKAKILSIVAAGIVGFAVMELLPAPVQSNVSQPSHASVDDIKPAPVLAKYTRDPFSSPLLRSHALAKPPSQSKSSEQASSSAKEAGEDTRDLLTGLHLPGALPPLQADLSVARTDAKTKESASLNRAHVTGNTTKLVLEATIKVGSPEALIVVGQGEARTFKAGDTMFKGVQISSVDSEGVTLRLEKKTIRLTVGQEISI